MCTPQGYKLGGEIVSMNKNFVKMISQKRKNNFSKNHILLVHIRRNVYTLGLQIGR